MYSLNNVNKDLIVKIIQEFPNKVVYIYGKNYQELDKILKSQAIEYYYFEDSEDFIIKLLLSKN